MIGSTTTGGGSVISSQTLPRVSYGIESAYIQKYIAPNITTSSGTAGSNGVVTFVFRTPLPFPPFLGTGTSPHADWIAVSRCIPKSFISTATCILCTTLGMTVQYKKDLVTFNPGDVLTTQATLTKSGIPPSNEFKLVARQQVNSLFGSTGLTVLCSAGTTIADLAAAGISPGKYLTTWGFTDTNYNVSGSHAGFINSVFVGNMGGWLPKTIGGVLYTSGVCIFYYAVKNLTYNTGQIDPGFCVAGTSQTVVSTAAYRVAVTNSDNT